MTITDNESTYWTWAWAWASFCPSRTNCLRHLNIQYIYTYTTMVETLYKPAEDAFSFLTDFDLPLPLPLPWGTGSSANVLYY
jgi:hypothetical protein